MNNRELLTLLGSEQQLKDKIAEALRVLEAAGLILSDGGLAGAGAAGTGGAQHHQRHQEPAG
eukprot:7140427-Lingulodinium_polyedra.AAC.1